ncbi:hypothetical protein BD413DRAFT_645615 [Trametes elegans]|nr:hypothetical protein BD413DRAFT_645615 [Trametes elegans]
MRTTALLATFFALFAGQVLAVLNITIPELGVIHQTQFLATNDSVLASCNATCVPAMDKITACQDDNACLCDANATVPAIVQCEQCMFTQLLALNRRPADGLAGQTSALAGASPLSLPSHYSLPFLTAVLPATLTALTLPPNWDGPFGQGLTTFGTVVTVLAASVLGTGLITVVNTM